MLFTDRDYCKAILLSENMGFSSVEKFFLIRVVCSYGVSGEVLATVDALEERLCLSESVLKRTRNNLIEKEYLTNLPDPVNRGGRPRKCFKITTRCLELLQASVLDEELCNREWVEELLFKDNLSEIRVPDRSGKTRKIRPPVRILMSVLLAHSSDVGLVSNLGHSDLRKLIGSTLDCLKSQMATLHEIGFILAMRSGFTHRQTGKLFKGQYALNFSWGELCGKLTAAQVVFCLGRMSWTAALKGSRDQVINAQYNKMIHDFKTRNGISSNELPRINSILSADIKRFIAWSIFELANGFINNQLEEEEMKSQVRPKVELILHENSFKEEFDFICDFMHFYVDMLVRKTTVISDHLYSGRVKGLRYFLVPNDYNPGNKGICILIFDRYRLDFTTITTELLVLESNNNKVKLLSSHENMDKVGTRIKEIYGFL